MSFITLQSKRNDISPQALDSTYFRNDFKNGVYVKTGDTISLVNLTINTIAEFIVTEQNDTIIFRLGSRTNYQQVIATLEHGAYDGEQLAVVVENALNNAVVGGIWKRYLDGTTQYGFVCTYDNSKPKEPKFNITMKQQVQPTDENLSDKIGYKVITNKVDTADPNSVPLSTNMTTQEVISGSDEYYKVDGEFTNERQGSVDMQLSSYSAIDIGQRGIFLNGGANVIETKPIKGIDTTDNDTALASFTNLYETGGGGLTGDVWKAVTNPNTTPVSWLVDAAGTAVNEVTCNIIKTTGTTAWDLKVTFTNPVEGGGGGVTSGFFLAYRGCIAGNLGIDNGAFVMGTNNTTDPTDSANWNAPIPYWWWDDKNKQLVGSTSQLSQQERFELNSAGDKITHIIKCVDPANEITCALVDCVGYSAISAGIVRQQFFYGDKNVADEAINLTDTGQDFAITIVPNTTNIIPDVKVTRIVGKGGTQWGNPNWRDGSGTGVIPLTGGINRPSLNNANIFAGNFQLGDRIKIGIEYYGLRSYTAFIMRAPKSNPNNYTDRKNLVSVGAGTPVSLVSISNSPIKQSRYNIRSVTSYGGGGYYDRSQHVIKGKNDRANYKDSGSVSTTVIPAEEDESLFTAVNTAPPQNPAGPDTLVISELNRNSRTGVHNASQTIVMPTQYQGYDVSKIELHLNNASGSVMDVVLDLYDSITDATSVYTSTRFSGLTPIATTPASQVAATSTTDPVEFTVNHDTSSLNTFYVVLREASGGSTSGLSIQGSYGSGSGTNGNMLADLKIQVTGNSPPTTFTFLSALTATTPIPSFPMLWKFGRINSGDLASDADMIPNDANTSDLLGMPTFFELKSGDTNPTAGIDFILTSTKIPEGNSTDLNMMVCLEDFNINGKNGNTGDDVKIICVVPKEQLTEGESNKNILHYTADFPIPIDLNVATDQTYYSLTASLRDMDGKFIQSLESPTTITLLHERDKKSQMGDAIARAMEKANDRRANEQSSIITNAGLNNPRI